MDAVPGALSEILSHSSTFDALVHGKEKLRDSYCVKADFVEDAFL